MKKLLLPIPFFSPLAVPCSAEDRRPDKTTQTIITVNEWFPRGGVAPEKRRHHLGAGGGNVTAVSEPNITKAKVGAPSINAPFRVYVSSCFASLIDPDGSPR